MSQFRLSLSTVSRLCCGPPQWSLFGDASLHGRHHSAARRSELMRNDRRHRAAPMTPTIFQDRIAAPVHALVLSQESLKWLDSEIPPQY
jgi:hypothetical protein